MEFNNKLTQEEIDKLTINKEYNKIEEKDEISNFQKPIEKEENNENVRFFEVLTDGYHFWVSVKDMQDICTQISISAVEAMCGRLDTDVVFGETYINVNDEFLISVQKNTKNPRYVPQLALLKTRDRDYDYENKNNTVKTQFLVQTVDDRIFVEEEYEGRTR